MKTTLRVFLGLAWACLGGVALVSATAASPTQTTTVLEGQVLMLDGGAAKARVGVLMKSDESKPFLWVETDERGTFQIELARAHDQVVLVAQASDLSESRTAPIRLDAARKVVAPIRVGARASPRGTFVRGTVVDEANSGVRNATVRLKRSGSELKAAGTTEVTSRSNANGAFYVQGLATGLYDIVVQAPGFESSTIRRFSTADSRALGGLTITMHRGTYVSGRVASSSGAPIANAQLTGTYGLSPPIDAFSNASGTFHLGPFVDGARLHLHVRARGFTPTHTDDVVSPSEGMLVQLSANGSLRGHVIDDETASAVERFAISFQQRGPLASAENPGSRQFSSTAGSFSWDDVYAGRWNIEVVAEGYAAKMVTGVFVPQGKPSDNIEIRLRKGAIVQGRIIDRSTSTGISGATVQLVTDSFPSVASSKGMTTRSRDDGVFEIADVPPGPGILTVSARDYATVVEDFGDGESPVEILMSAASAITGEVLAQDGAPTVAEVSMRNPKSGDSYSRPTDALGRFRFANLDAGTYLLSAKSSKGSSSPQSVEVTPSAQIEGVTLLLEKGRAISGTVLGLLSGEHGHTQIEIHGANDFYVGSQTDEDDRYRFAGLPTGELEIVATTRLDRRLSRRAPELALSETDFDFEFTGTSRLSGVVTRAGKPVPFVQISATPKSGGGPVVSAETTASGQYVMLGLSAGIYSVSAKGIEASVDVTSQQVLNISLPEQIVGGQILDDAGMAVEGALVELIAIRPGPQFRASARTDYLGHYSVVDVPKGKYRLTAQMSGFRLYERELEVSSSQESVNARLHRAESIPFQVIGESGEPVRVIWVYERFFGESGYRAEVVLDSNGRGALQAGLEGRDLVFASTEYPSYEVKAWNGHPLKIVLNGKK